MKFCAPLKLSIAVSIFYLFSCQKASNNNRPVTPVNPADSSYISALYYVVPDANGNFTDKLRVFKYYYDNSKRVTEIVDSSFPVQGHSEYYERMYLRYSGADSLPYLSQLYAVDNGRGLMDTVIQYYFYDTNGRKIKDSSNNFSLYSTGQYYQSREVDEYLYQPGKIFASGYSTSVNYSSSDSTFTKDTALLDANNNVISSMRYYRDGSYDTFKVGLITSINYDSHYSPFLKLTSSKAFFVVPGLENLYMEMFEGNNCTEINQTLQDASSVITFQYHEKYNFTYKPNGYPAEMIDTDVLHSSGDGKYIFIYTAL